MKSNNFPYEQYRFEKQFSRPIKIKKNKNKKNKTGFDKKQFW